MTRNLHWISFCIAVFAVAILLFGYVDSQRVVRTKRAASDEAGISPYAAAGHPRIEVEEESFDFGRVPLNKVVSHTFLIKNVGDAPLILMEKPSVRAVQGC